MKNNTKNFATISSPLAFGMMVLLLSVTISPALATSSTNSGPFSPNYQNPSYPTCTGASQACAHVSSGGNNFVIAKATSSLETNVADADNNEDFTSFTYGTSPSLTTSSNVWYKSSVTYGGSLTIASFATAYYQPSTTLWDSGSSSTLGSCLGPKINTAGVTSNTSVFSCAFTHSGSDTYYMGIDHEAYASNSLLGGTTVTDFWNSPYHAQTNYLELCDFNC